MKIFFYQNNLDKMLDKNMNKKIQNIFNKIKEMSNCNYKKKDSNNKK